MSKLRKPFIPEDAEWYLADIVQEITVEEDPRNVVHINTVLVNAKSPEEAMPVHWSLVVKANSLIPIVVAGR